MNFNAYIKSVQSPEPKDGPAAVKIVLEVLRAEVDVNELLDLRDEGSVAVTVLPRTKQQPLPFDRPVVEIGPDEAEQDEAATEETAQEDVAEAEVTQEPLFGAGEEADEAAGEESATEEMDKPAEDAAEAPQDERQQLMEEAGNDDLQDDQADV